MKIKSFLCIILCLLLLFVSSCSNPVSDIDSVDSEIVNSEQSFPNSSEIHIETQKQQQQIDKLSVHFIDVGQGDAIFIELPGSKTMLIDAGEKEYSNTVVKFIENLGYKTISYVVGTHPHSDHIGGLEDIIDSFDIENIYMPKVSTNTKTFEDLLLAIKNKALKITTAKKGMKIFDENDLSATVLSPTDEKYSNLNNYSVIILLRYKNKNFLFTGDAEKEAENKLQENISCDVLKVGHHGSNSSSTESFLKKVSPKYAVISYDKDNVYGHPHKETLNKLNKFNIECLTTEKSGTITFVTDGIELKIIKERNETSAQDSNIKNVYEKHLLILNVSTKKIHKSDCRAVNAMNDDNKLESKQSVLELEKQGYSKCQICKPEESYESNN